MRKQEESTFFPETSDDSAYFLLMLSFGMMMMMTEQHDFIVFAAHSSEIRNGREENKSFEEYLFASMFNKSFDRHRTIWMTLLVGEISFSLSLSLYLYRFGEQDITKI